MFLGGLQKISLIDYPGKVSCVVFLSGCNFHCPYCHNPQLVRNSPGSHSFLKEQDLQRFLRKSKGLLDGVVVSGGEPTLQKDLPRFCERIKKMGYLLKLDTNGSNPRAIKQLIKGGLVDYIAMDMKTDPFNYAPLLSKDCEPQDLIASTHIIIASSPAYEFRTTCVKPFVTPQSIEIIAKTIKGALLYVLQHFRKGHLLDPGRLQGVESETTPEEINHLKSIAEPWVKRCTLR